MTFKTVAPPGLLGELGGDPLFGLLDGPAAALLIAAIGAALFARAMARNS